MLRRWLDRLRARLGDDGASLWLVRRQPNGRQQTLHLSDVRLAATKTELVDVVGALDEALRAAVDKGQGVARLRCDVVIADTWMLYDVIDADLDQTPRRTVDQMVNAALADTAGIKPDELVTRWQRQDAARSLACGVPASALTALQSTLRQHGVRLGSVTGELVDVFNANRHGLSRERSVLAVACPAGTQLSFIVDGGFAALRFEPGVREATPLLERSHALMRCAGYGPDALTKYYADETLPFNADSPWAGRTPRVPLRQRLISRRDMARLDLDLSPTRPRVPLASWLLLAVGALAATLAIVQFQHATAARGHQARELHALESSLSEPAGRNGAPATTQDARAVRESAAALRELQIPWANLLVALESVAGRHVALLSIEPSAQRQEIRITAEAKNSAAMLDFLDSLRAQSLRDVALISHQVQSQAGTPIRFQARAQWDMP